MGKMKELAIQMANERGVPIEEIIYNDQASEEHHYEEFRREQGLISAEKAQLTSQRKEGTDVSKTK